MTSPLRRRLKRLEEWPQYRGVYAVIPRREAGEAWNEAAARTRREHRIPEGGTVYAALIPERQAMTVDRR